MKKLLPLLLAAPLLSTQAQAAGNVLQDPLDPAYNFVGLSYAGGDYSYSAAQIDASVALGRVPYLFALGTVGGKADVGDTDIYGLGIGFRIRTSEATSLDIDLAYAQQQIESYDDNNMLGLGLGFRAALGDSWILIARARYFVSDLTIVDNIVNYEDFLELSLGASYYVNDRFSIDANLRKYIGQNDPFTYSIGGSFHF
jgi:long-subunit fatty acid transport protein